MVVRVKWDRTGLRFRLEKWMQRQVPFVLSRAVNFTIKEAQEELRDELPKTFTIRSGRVARGVRIKTANKKRPIGIVGTVDDFMARQITGGTKTGKKIAVPQVGRGRARPRKASKTIESRWPGALRRTRKGFYRPGRGKTTMLFLPRGKRGLLIAYIMTPQVKVKESGWSIEGTLQRIATREWIDNVEMAWRVALKTARR